MSANFIQEDRQWLIASIKRHEYDNNLFLQTFEEQTNFDVTKIKNKIAKEKFLRRVCLYKILLSPLEYLLTFILFGYNKLKDKMLLNKLYKQYYKKKISLENFQKELQDLIKDGKIF